jgi:hypothetical protein
MRLRANVVRSRGLRRYLWVLLNNLDLLSTQMSLFWFVQQSNKLFIEPLSSNWADINMRYIGLPSHNSMQSLTKNGR